jgi:hypothetical protein
MDELTPSQWIAKCAERFHDRWRTVELGRLEEVAAGLWQHTELRRLPPDEAASQWLRPIADPL